MDFIQVAKTTDLAEGQAMSVKVGDEEVALFLIDGTYYAVSDTCPHRDGPLHEGLVEGTTVTCPWHFAKFDLRTGSVVEPPARSDIKTYRVRVEGDAIMLAAPSKEPTH